MKTKLTKENAQLEFEKIVDCFGFYVPEEAKTQKIETEIGGMAISLQQDIEQAAVMIQKIQEGKIEFDDENEKIIYNFRKEIDLGDGEAKIKSVSFGDFTMGRLKQIGIDVKQCNVSNMTTEERIKVLSSMNGVSNDKLYDRLSYTVFNDLWTIAGYFFS